MNRCLLGLVFLSGLFSYTAFSQQSADIVKFQDTSKVEALNEVVITGQYNKQSVSKSIYEVQVINRRQIERLAANNLTDVLNHTLNLTIFPNSSTGKSSVSLFGLDGQYFKILVDNIPLLNEEGLGNNTDLTQINLDDIEQIEIVEGSMGVEYGADAVSGIINIITKKSSRHKWEITPYIQEETIGNEYNLSDKGRHIQSLSIGHNISDKWYANASFYRQDFKGHFGERKGKNHLLNDGLRGYEFLPKQQWSVKGLLRYNHENFNAFYRIEYFDEAIQRYNRTVRENPDPATLITRPSASDEDHFTNRMFHHLGVEGKFAKKWDYNWTFSYQEQKRQVDDFTYFIKTGEKRNLQHYELESKNGIYSKGTTSSTLEFLPLKVQLGYELFNIKGFASPFSGEFIQDPINKRSESYDFFGSAELALTDKFNIRLGIRYMMNSAFSNEVALSLSSKYALPNGYELRAIVGTSPRNPNYDELYTYFVDVNHNVLGNENLQPERGSSVFLHLKKDYWFRDSTVRWSNKLSGYYLNVDDRIELAVVNTTPLVYQFININKFRTWGLTYQQTLGFGNLQFGTGFVFAGQSKSINSEENWNDDFLYSLSMNANLSYEFPEAQTLISVLYKFNGPEEEYVQRQYQGDNVMTKGKRDSFQWLDASIRKHFFDKRFELTVGARNLLNVTRVNSSAFSGGELHSNAMTSLLLGYGRSYFVKLQYNLRI